MNYKIRITYADDTNTILQAVLLREVVVLFIFNFWVTVKSLYGDKEYIDYRVDFWKKSFDIPTENLTDLTI